jgi:acyl-CoA thioester hydrolase
MLPLNQIGQARSVYNRPAPEPERPDVLKNAPAPVRLEVRYADLDPYGHVNNAVYLAYFEQIRMAYWRALADLAGITELEAGDVPGARYVIAETTLRFKAPIFFDHALYGAATVPWVGNRSYAMDFELRTGDSFETGELACDGSAAHVFFDPVKDEVQPRPEWFLPTVAALEGRPENDFAQPES